MPVATGGDILTPTIVTREAARLLYNNLKLIQGVNRQYDDSFQLGGAKGGTITNMRLPQRYTVASGPNLSVQAQDEYSRPLALDQQKHIDVRFSSVELTLKLQDFSDRVLAPAMVQLANQMDQDMATTMHDNTFNAVGTPGATPNTLLVYAQADAILAQMACPQDNLHTACLEPMAMATIFDSLKGLTEDSALIAAQYRSGLVTRAAGLNWYRDQNLVSHTVGPLGGSPQVSGANQGILTGWAAYTDVTVSGFTASAAVRLNKGDIITFTGVQAVNPVSRTSVGRLQQFVVASTTEGNVSSDGSGNATVRVRPAIIAGGQYQNVTARPANGAPIAVFGTAAQVGPRNMVYHQDSYVFASADLEMPDGVDWKARVALPQLGFSVRAVREYDINTDAFPARFDVLYGTAPLYPELACVVAG